jgi:hypothetical protein
MLRTTVAAVATAGAALLTVGTAGAASASPATAGTATAAHPVIYTSSQGGYTVSGRWFRYVATYFKVPAAGAVDSYAQVVLGGNKAGPVTLAQKAGGGANSIGWSVGIPPFGMGGGVFTKISPAVGDTVLLDLYYNQAKGGVTATATDVTTNTTDSITIAQGTKALFTSAEVACVIHNPASPPASNSRLWQFNNSHVTTYTGLRGSMTGKWTTSQVIDTTNGHATGHVVMSPSFLFNKGGDFGAWLRTWLR